MVKRPNRKRTDINYCPLKAKRKKRTIYCCLEKENFMDYSNLNIKPNEKNIAEYLYADPFFIKQTKIDSYNRLEGGGGASEKEIFYDCFPCEYEPETYNSGQPQLQIFEVINEIQNPKEFKSLLKQMAYTSNALYRTFRQAYNKTKKCKCFAENCNKIYEKPVDKLARGDMNPLEIVDIEVPPNKKEYVEDIRYESWNKTKHKKKKSCKNETYGEEQECFCYICSNCQKLNNDEEKVCTICKGPVEEEAISCEGKTSASETKKFEHFLEAKENSLECNFKREYKWFPQDVCLKETNVCDKFEDELKDLNFCDRCAVLRGETPWPSKMEDETLCNYKPNITEKSSQSCQKPNKSCEMEPCCKTKKICQECPQTTKQILNLNPVCLTIPLKLQIDSQNCQSRFIETEIVMEACGGFQNQFTTCLNKPEAMQAKSEPICSNPHTPRNKQVKSGSDLFYSCISNSGIIKPDETKRIRYDTSLTEVLDIIKKRKSNPEEISKTCQIATTKQLEEKGIQLPIRSSLPITTLSYAKDPTGRTDFTQTEEIFKPTKPTTAPASIPTPATTSASNVLDPKAKAKKLRADLLEEIKSALEKSTPVAALKALLEGKRFSLPTDLRPKEVTNIAPIRHSFPSSYQNMPTITKPPQSLKPLTTITQAGSSKPAVPPKPTLPPKTITETVQTDASTLKASGHYKRNEMRTEIKENLKELLEPNPSKPQPKYKPEERDEILLDLHKLFHPQKAGRLPKQISRENALQDINYLVSPEKFGAPMQTSDSQESVIQCVKNILNPKSQARKPKGKKYTKETKEKILEDFQIILNPRDKKKEANQEIRNSVLYDLRFMLDTGEGATSPQRPPRLSELQQRTSMQVQGPGTSRAQQVRQQRQQKPPNEIRDSLIADLRYMLDYTHPATEPIAPSPPAKPKRTHSSTSSEGSLFELEKPSSRHK